MIGTSISEPLSIGSCFFCFSKWFHAYLYCPLRLPCIGFLSLKIWTCRSAVKGVHMCDLPDSNDSVGLKGYHLPTFLFLVANTFINESVVHPSDSSNCHMETHRGNLHLVPSDNDFHYVLMWEASRSIMWQSFNGQGELFRSFQLSRACARNYDSAWTTIKLLESCIQTF